MRKNQGELPDWTDGKRKPGRIITESMHPLKGDILDFRSLLEFKFPDRDDWADPDSGLLSMGSKIVDGSPMVTLTTASLRPRERAIKEMIGRDDFTGEVKTRWRDGGLRHPTRPTDYSESKWNKTVVEVLRKNLPESLGQYQMIYQLNDGGVVGKPEVIKL